MRAADVFAAGAIAGAVVVWLWGKEIENFLGARRHGSRVTPPIAPAEGQEN
jgi:hypothetical protein